MKLFNRTSLPESIKYNGRIYTKHTDFSTIGLQVRELELKGYTCIKVKVLSRNLKGRTDLRGNLYKPTEWIYKAPKAKQVTDEIGIPHFLS